MKLVEPPERSRLDRFKSDPNRVQREKRFARIAIRIRNMLDADEYEDVIMAAIEDMDLSRQDIEGARQFLVRDTRIAMNVNKRIDALLAALTPKRIWSGRQ